MANLEGATKTSKRSRRSTKKAVAQAGAQPVTLSVAQPIAQPDTGPDAQPDTLRDAQPDAKLNDQPDAHPGVRPDAQRGAQPDTQPTILPMSPDGPQEPGATTATTSTVMTSPLDHILIFGHGRFQWIVLLYTALAYFTTISHSMATAGLARPIDHWCRLPPEYSGIPEATWKNSNIPFEADGKTRSECLRYEPPYSMTEEQGAENRTVISCDAGWDYDKAAEADVGVYSIVNQWDLVCERRWIMALLMALYMSGGVLGAAIAGISADTVGRRPVLRISIFVLALAGVTLTFSGTLAMFATLRTVISAAASSIVVTSVVILFEVTDTPHRALFSTLAVAAASLTAVVYGELVNQLAPSWQLAQIAYMAPTSILIAAVYWMEESPCWLLAVSNMRRAESVLCWAARVNKVEPEVFKTRLSGLRMELKRQQEQPEPGAPEIFTQEHGLC
nr:organic anion transporter 3-like [Dermacentor andersoni]